MDKMDVQNAFGKADIGFKHNVYEALGRVETYGKVKTMKRVGLRMAVVVVALLAVGASVVAMKKQWGVLDFLNNDRKVEVLPEAANDVQKEVEQTIQKGERMDGKHEIATFQVREAVFDGSYVYIVIAVKPNDQKSLLIGLDAQPSDTFLDYGKTLNGGTILEYAKENDMSLYHITIDNQSWDVNAANCVYEEDGTLVYMLSGNGNGDMGEPSMEFECSVTPYTVVKNQYKPDESRQTKETLTCNLAAAKNLGTVINQKPVVMEESGIRIDKVTLTGSSMAVYAQVEYTVVDKKRFHKNEEGLWIVFLDEKGDRIPDGAPSSATLGNMDGDESRFLQTCSLQAVKTMPKEINISIRNTQDGVHYETYRLKMTKKKD